MGFNLPFVAREELTRDLYSDGLQTFGFFDPRTFGMSYSFCVPNIGQYVVSASTPAQGGQDQQPSQHVTQPVTPPGPVSHIPGTVSCQQCGYVNQVPQNVPVGRGMPLIQVQPFVIPFYYVVPVLPFWNLQLTLFDTVRMEWFNNDEANKLRYDSVRRGNEFSAQLSFHFFNDDGKGYAIGEGKTFLRRVTDRLWGYKIYHFTGPYDVGTYTGNRTRNFTPTSNVWGITNLHGINIEQRIFDGINAAQQAAPGAPGAAPPGPAVPPAQPPVPPAQPGAVPAPAGGPPGGPGIAGVQAIQFSVGEPEPLGELLGRPVLFFPLKN